MTYYCTICPGICLCSFDTYNDWIRHEILHGQHHSVFYCGEPYTSPPPPTPATASNTSPASLAHTSTPSVQTCHFASFSPTTLHKHLLSAHSLSASPNSSLLEHMVGPNHRKWWCGFCVGVIRVSVRGEKAWDRDRFGHTEEHFLGTNGREKALIEDFVDLDMEE